MTRILPANADARIQLGAVANFDQINGYLYDATDLLRHIYQEVQ